jgi:hypothetical protein
MRVLADNLLLRGFYSYLKGNVHNEFAKDCFWQITESIILYDSIIVTNVDNDVTDELSEQLKTILFLTDHENELGLPDDWWVSKKEALLPDFIKFNLRQATNASHLNTRYNPFELLEIERLGFGDQKPLELKELKQIILSEKPTWTYTKDFKAFQIYHAYFSCYCTQVAHKRGIPYTPNPSRFSLFLRQSDSDFYYPDLRRRIIEEFGEIRRQMLIEVSRYFSVTKDELDVPLVANYIKSKTNSPIDSLLFALDLRQSDGAIAFRNYCSLAEVSRDLGYLLEVKNELTKFGDSIRNSISFEQSQRKVKIRKGSLKANPSPNAAQANHTLLNRLGLSNIPDHFIFLHDLVREK